jgi:hypothetical protein
MSNASNGYMAKPPLYEYNEAEEAADPRYADEQVIRRPSQASSQASCSMKKSDTDFSDAASIGNKSEHSNTQFSTRTAPHKPSPRMDMREPKRAVSHELMRCIHVNDNDVVVVADDDDAKLRLVADHAPIVDDHEKQVFVGETLNGESESTSYLTLRSDVL